LNNTAYFFQADSLLIPSDLPESQIRKSLPLYLSDQFDSPDIFEIPSLNDYETEITVVSVPPETTIPENWRSIPMRSLLNMFYANGSIVDSSSCTCLVRACHIAQWRMTSRFCGSCGSKNSNVPRQICRACPSCGNLEFPRICPAVITIITDNENRILLAHNKRFKEGVYSLISGFNEAGETLEETVTREIREEVNIEVKDIEYVKSQPWPFPNSLMLGFKARYASGTLKPDGEEIEDAQWFTKDNLPQLPGAGSLARALINNWMNTIV